MPELLPLRDRFTYLFLSGFTQSLMRSRMRYSRFIPPMYQNPQHATPSPSGKPRVPGVLSSITD